MRRIVPLTFILIFFFTGELRASWGALAEYRTDVLDEEKLTPYRRYKVWWKNQPDTEAQGSVTRVEDGTWASAYLQHKERIFFLAGDYHARFGEGLIFPGERRLDIDPFTAKSHTEGQASFSPVRNGTGVYGFRGMALGWRAPLDPAPGVRVFYSIRQRWSRGTAESPWSLLPYLWKDGDRNIPVQIHDSGGALCLYWNRFFYSEVYAGATWMCDERAQRMPWNQDGISRRENDISSCGGCGGLVRYSDDCLSLWIEGGLTSLGTESCRNNKYTGKGFLTGCRFTHPAFKFFMEGSHRQGDFYAPMAEESRNGKKLEMETELFYSREFSSGCRVMSRTRNNIPATGISRTVVQREEIFCKAKARSVEGEGHFCRVTGYDFRGHQSGVDIKLFPRSKFSTGMRALMRQREGNYSFGSTVSGQYKDSFFDVKVSAGGYHVSDGNSLYVTADWRHGGVCAMSATGWIASVSAGVNWEAMVLEIGYGQTGESGRLRTGQMEAALGVTF